MAGFPPLYSDLGYLIVGAALARHTSALDAGEAIEEHVVAALEARRELGTARALVSAGVDFEGRAVPTEDVAWRGGIVRGRVHDENAWALTGAGGSGHAGMFGTVSGVLAFTRAVLEALVGRGPFAPTDIGWLTRARVGGTLRAGFDGKSAHGSSAGPSFGPHSIGHLGFTGTSLWIDSASGVGVVLLTNRVYPTRENTAIRAARPAAHEALFRRALEL
jgi:CubicO group peptidase (beta-lactamase class C family)